MDLCRGDEQQLDYASGPDALGLGAGKDAVGGGVRSGVGFGRAARPARSDPPAGQNFIHAALTVPPQTGYFSTQSRPGPSASQHFEVEARWKERSPVTTSIPPLQPSGRSSPVQQQLPTRLRGAYGPSRMHQIPARTSSG